jgi:hypothetical protein
VFQDFPLSFEIAISTPETPLLSVALQATWSVVPGLTVLVESGELIDITGSSSSTERVAMDVLVAVGITVGVNVTGLPKKFDTWDDDLTLQLLVPDPSFPARSLAVTRIMKVPDASAGTINE